MVGCRHSWCRGQITRCNKLHKTRKGREQSRTGLFGVLLKYFYVPELDACKVQAFVHHPEMLKGMLRTLAAGAKGYLLHLHKTLHTCTHII